MEGIFLSIPSSLDPTFQSSKSALIRLVALNWLVMVWSFFNFFVQIKQKKPKQTQPKQSQLAVRVG